MSALHPTETGTQPSADTLPLKGLRVLELGHYVAVPAAGQLLADLGAEVIKVEPPLGDAARQVGWTRDDCGPMFAGYNRGKKSVVLDMKEDGGPAAMMRLIEGADVLLHNFRAGVAERLGLGSEALTQRFPRLVYGQVSGYGQTGPQSHKPGFDIALQAESGMMSLNGAADREAVRVGFTVIDVLASRTLAAGVLAALVRRGVSDRGGVVNVSLLEIGLEAIASAWSEFSLFDVMPQRCGNGQATFAPAADLLPTADGMIVLSAYTEDHFRRLCQAISRPDMAEDPRFSANSARVAHRAVLLQELGQALSSFTSDQICQKLSVAGVVAGVVRTLREARETYGGDDYGIFVNVDAAQRADMRIPGLPFTMDGCPRRGGHLPSLGEHTKEFL